jgi:hypothetical protein
VISQREFNPRNSVTRAQTAPRLLRL